MPDKQRDPLKPIVDDDAGDVESSPDTSTLPFSPTNRPSGGRRGVPDDGRPAELPRELLVIPRRCLLCGARYDDRRRVCERDGAVLDDDLDALVGATLDGRYRVESILGRGGMGVVLRARDVELDRTVAIKLLDDRYASEPIALRRFVREGRIARQFVHPAVVGIHDLVCGDTGPVYLVLEFVAGRTLGAVLRERGQFTPTHAVEIARPIADALDSAHARGIVHRDLKPENIMIREAPAEPRAKLLDLGIAIVHATADQGADTRLTREGHWIGTPLYMSPEQWNAATDDAGVDGRADVYALGVVVHQLVSGTTPFSGDIGALRTQHLEGRPRRLDAAVAGVPRAFADAVARAMAKDRSDRFTTAGELVRALEASLSAPDLDRTLPSSVAPAETLMEATVSGASTVTFDAAMTGDTERPPGNLPAQATSFITPDGAVGAVATLFDRARCVTLTGPGGVGKTRLSLEVAARVDARFPGGTWFVDLAAIADPALVSQSVANAIGARERPGESLATSIHERIGDAKLLVVLDNCEHVVDAAAELAADLLRACPRACVLATSREGLAIPGESVFKVSPLTVPASGAVENELRNSTAIQLFLERARAATPAFEPATSDFETMGAICRRLDGLPLAIELAAARVRSLGLGELLSRLDDRFLLLSASERGRPSRQRTLHAAIDWSYRMLGDDERALLGRLAVFAAGATLEAIELVCPDTGDAAVLRCESVADLVDGLVAKSLIVAELEHRPVRYRMFESIRAFALAALDEAGEREAIEKRVDDWVVAMARSCGSARSTPAQASEEARVLAELDTVRQSLERLSRRDDGGNGLTAAAAWLGAFFESHGLLTEGRAWLDAAVGSETAHPDRGRALFWSGMLALDQGDYVGAHDRFEASLANAREAGDRPATARGLRALAHLSVRRSDESAAVSLATEAVTLYRELGDESGEAASTRILARVATVRGDFEAARPLLERTEAIHRRRREERDLAIDCYGLGVVLARLGDRESAGRRIAESVSIAERLGDIQTLAYATYATGAVASELGDPVAGLGAFRRALEMAIGLGDHSMIVHSIEGIAGTLSLTGAFEAAVALAAAAAERRRSMQQPLFEHEQTMLDRQLAPAREGLSIDSIAAAEDRGAGLSFDAVVAEALDQQGD